MSFRRQAFGKDSILHSRLSRAGARERDFTGSSSVFPVVFDERYATARLIDFADRFKLFKFGYSWGGVTSLAVVHGQVDRADQGRVGALIRFNIELEEPSDLTADLSRAFDRNE